MILYEYTGQLRQMDQQALLAAFSETESKCRTGKLSYAKEPLFKEQIEAVKTMWSPPARDFVKQQARKIAGGGPVTVSVIKAAIIETIKQSMAPAIANAKGQVADQEIPRLIAELSLRSIFRGMVGIGELKFKGMTFRIRTSPAPKRLVVNEGEECLSDAIVMATTIPEGMSYLLGWATKEDLLAAPLGNSDTDSSCTWKNMARHIYVEKLRPITELTSMSGFKEFLPGTFFETPPARGMIPVEATWKQQEGWRLATAEREEFSFEKMFGLPAKI